MNNTITALAVVSNVELAEAKASGKWPLARITVLSGDPDPATGRKRRYYAEIVSNPDAGWVTKGDPGRYIEQAELEDLKHAAWAAVEVFHQRRCVVMEHGTHILDVDVSKTPEAVVGAVAAWSTHPTFGKYAPSEGWVQLLARNVGGGHVHYVAGGLLSDGQETKYDYEDMLTEGTANFRLFIPPFLDAVREGGGEKSWVDALIESLELEPEASKAKSREALTRWHMNDDAFQGARRDIVTGRVPGMEALVLNSVVDGEVIDLSEVESGARLYVYAKVGPQWISLRTVLWDQSATAVALVNRNRQYRFSLSPLTK